MQWHHWRQGRNSKWALSQFVLVTLCIFFAGSTLGWWFGRHYLPTLTPEWLPIRIQIEWQRLLTWFHPIMEPSLEQTASTQTTQSPKILGDHSAAQVEAQAFLMQQQLSDLQQQLRQLASQSQLPDSPSETCNQVIESFFQPDQANLQLNWGSLLPSSYAFFNQVVFETPKSMQQLFYELESTDSEYSIWSHAFERQSKIVFSTVNFGELFWYIDCRADYCVIWGHLREIEGEQFQLGVKLLADIEETLADGGHSRSPRSLTSLRDYSNSILFAWAYAKYPKPLYNPGLPPASDNVGLW